MMYFNFAQDAQDNGIDPEDIRSRFHVSEEVGTALENLQILSKKQMEEQDVHVPLLNDLENNFTWFNINY